MNTAQQCKPTATWSQTTASIAFLQAASQGKRHHSTRKGARKQRQNNSAAWNWDGAWTDAYSTWKWRWTPHGTAPEWMPTVPQIAPESGAEHRVGLRLNRRLQRLKSRLKLALNGTKMAPSDPQHDLISNRAWKWHQGLKYR